ncbi:DNA-directed RNA polymerase subunit beta [Sporolactobacillus sp. THM7-4]|nr:DNA-directed RNA polymerase subunit beta [Sporolactobacillus sp. THM7-4]
MKENTPAEEMTRQSIRLARKKAQKEERKSERKPAGREEEKPLYNPFFNNRKRKFPIWQRLIALISLCTIALIGGAMFGYGVLGHGNPLDVFHWATWQHILDFLKVK